MDLLRFRESIELLQEHTPEEIQQAKVSTLSLIEGLYEERLSVSDEIKRTILHYSSVERVRNRKSIQIENVLIPKRKLRVQQQLSSFYGFGKAATIKQLKNLLREKEYLQNAKTEHTLRVKQVARTLILLYADIKKAENQYDLLMKSDHIRDFLIKNGTSAGMMNNTNMERWHRQYMQGGGVGVV